MKAALTKLDLHNLAKAAERKPFKRNDVFNCGDRYVLSFLQSCTCFVLPNKEERVFHEGLSLTDNVEFVFGGDSECILISKAYINCVISGGLPRLLCEIEELYIPSVSTIK